MAQQVAREARRACVARALGNTARYDIAPLRWPFRFASRF